MKKAFIATLVILAVLGAFCIAIVYWFITGIDFNLTGQSIPISLLDTGESYTIKGVPLLGGDGMQCFDVYKTAANTLVGRACSGEAFNENDSTPLDVWAKERSLPEDLVMFYKPSTKQLFRADNNCELSDADTREYQDADLGISVRVPRVLQMEKTTTDSAKGLSLYYYGEFAWCTAVSLQHSITIERWDHFNSIQTTLQLQAYLQKHYPRYEIVEQGEKEFLVVAQTVHGTIGGTKEYVVWAVTKSGTIYHITFDRYMNLENVKSFLKTLKFL